VWPNAEAWDCEPAHTAGDLESSDGSADTIHIDGKWIPNRW
jgi:hypothetical protein